jgi:hypothetical protein
LDAYDYAAAVLLAQEIAEFLPAEGLPMLRAAACRLQLDQSGYTKETKGMELDWIPIKTGNQRQLFEYVLGLQIRLRQKNYVDFIRGLTPVVRDLFEACLKNELGIDIHTCCVQTGRSDRKVEKLSVDQMKKTPQGQKVLAALQNSFYEVREEPYNSMHIYRVFEACSQDKDLVRDLGAMRDVETRVRNFAAHEIVSVTEQWVKGQVGMTPEEIMKLLRRIIMHAGINIKPEYWESYDRMNQQIKAALGG